MCLKPACLPMFLEPLRENALPKSSEGTLLTAPCSFVWTSAPRLWTRAEMLHTVWHLLLFSFSFDRVSFFIYSKRHNSLSQALDDCNPGSLHLMLLGHTVLQTIKTLMHLKYVVLRTGYKTYNVALIVGRAVHVFRSISRRRRRKGSRRRRRCRNKVV